MPQVDVHADDPQSLMLITVIGSLGGPYLERDHFINGDVETVLGGRREKTYRCLATGMRRRSTSAITMGLGRIGRSDRSP